MAHEPGLARPQRGANREFARPSRSSRKHQVRHIDASNQQHETNSGQQHEEQHADTPNHRLFQRPQEGADSGVRVRVSRGKVARNSRQVRPCLLDADSGLQSPHAVEPEPRASLWKKRVFPLPHRCIDIHSTETSGKIEARRKHTNNRKALAVKI